MRIIRNAKSKLLIATLMMVVFALAASLFFIQGQATQVYAFADSSVDAEIKGEYSAFGKASIEDDFADDRILVVLNRQETLRFKSWGIKDFSEINYFFC